MTTHNGKIARLPAHVREQLNQRLHDGESGSSLVDWLNSLPEVQAVLAASFHGQPISEQNLSQWRQRGFEDWLAQQEVLGAVRQTIEAAAQLKETVPGSLADPMAQLLIARLSVALAKLKPHGENGETNNALLHTLCVDLVELRRGDQTAERLLIDRERLALERERLEMERQQAQQRTIKQFLEWSEDPEVRECICGRQDTSKKMEWLMRLMFGDPPDESFGPLGYNPHTGRIADAKPEAGKPPCGSGPQTESHQITPNQAGEGQ